MPNASKQQLGFRFGLFEVNLPARELRKSGVKLKVQDQPFAVLLLLLGRGGGIVTREEIQKHLWLEDTYVDFDNAINSAVRKLREVLCDSPEHARFIETIPRRGYRFIAPVQAINEEVNGAINEGSGQTRDAVAAERRREYAGNRLGAADWRSRAALTKTSAAMLACAGMLLAVGLWSRGKKPTIANVHVTQLSSATGLELQPAISPDGTRVAYAWTVAPDKQPEIYVRQEGAGDPIQVSRDLTRVFSPAWSPDGRWIAALQDLGSRGVIVLIPASGGPIRRLARVVKGEASDDTCAATDFPFICGPSSFGSEMAWSPDSKYLFTSAKTRAGLFPGIVRVTVEDGAIEAITKPSKDTSGDFNPAISPDGRQLAFGRFKTHRTGDLFVLTLDEHGTSGAAGEPKRLTSDGADLMTAAWTADSRELIFSSDRDGRRALWRVPAMGGELSRVSGFGEEALDVAVQGKKLIYNHGHYSGSLWKISIAGRRGGKPIRVTATTSRDKFSQFAPDGKRIVFQSARSGVDEIWSCGDDGRDAVQLTNFGRGFSGSPRWSPDGRFIAFDSNVAGNFHIYTMSADGGRPKQITSGPATDAVPSWSQDGQWIYFTSWRTGRSEVWKVSAKGGEARQLTNDQGGLAFESSDGEYVYFVRGSEEKGSLWRMPSKGGQPSKILDAVEGRLFTIFPHGLYFSRGSPNLELQYLAFADHSISKVTALPGMPHADISRDESWVLYPKLAMTDTNMLVVDNFK
jgi:Tol biopolymer transport system component/DNA-binding winged helix-turn-helix (wHTH) protein